MQACNAVAVRVGGSGEQSQMLQAGQTARRYEGLHPPLSCGETPLRGSFWCRQAGFQPSAPAQQGASRTTAGMPRICTCNNKNRQCDDPKHNHRAHLDTQSTTAPRDARCLKTHAWGLRARAAKTSAPTSTYSPVRRLLSRPRPGPRAHRQPSAAPAAVSKPTPGPPRTRRNNKRAHPDL